MDLRHLRYFQAVAREGGFTKAAAALHIAQPPLSRQVRQLEEELGVKLLERGARGVKLTEAGRFFYEQSLQLNARLEEIVAGTRRLGAGATRWFGLGFVPSALYDFMPEFIRSLREVDARVDVSLVEMTTLPQIEALKSGRIDLGIGRIRFEDPAIERRVLHDEPLVAALPETHPLAGRARLSVAELATQPFILYPARPRPNYADHVLALFKTAGYRLTVVQEANELQTALGLVVAGIGITLVPAAAQRLHRSGLICLPIDEPSFTSPMILSWRRDDTSPFLAQAVEMAERLARKEALKRPVT
jgi:DNA-binding transcriptional LysR family regulator